jgi:cation:H+ antiporter
VTVAAARSGALDLAIGNLLGSNLFNMVVLALDITLMLPADLMSRVSGAHMASVLSAIVMSAAVMLALASPPRQRLLNAISWTSAALVLVFLVNVWLQVQWRH